MSTRIQGSIIYRLASLFTAIWIMHSPNPAAAQEVTLDFVATTGDTGYDAGSSMATDSSGNVYTLGLFGGTVDFDFGEEVSTLTELELFDVFIQKLDNSGNLIWVKKLEGTLMSAGEGIAIDGSDNLIIRGYFFGTVDFDPGVDAFNITTTAFTQFILKLDFDGNFLWAKSYDSDYENIRVSDLCTDGQGNIYYTGFLAATADMDPSAGTDNRSTAGGDDVFITKLDSNGDYQWTRLFGSTSTDEGSAIAVDSSGNVYATGSFSGTVDFDLSEETSNLISTYPNDIFILKLDSAGDYVWAKALASTDFLDSGNSSDIAVDASSNVYTVGQTSNTWDFDPGPDTYTLVHGDDLHDFICKLDANGDFVWATSTVGTDFSNLNAIALDATGNAYVTGRLGTYIFIPEDDNATSIVDLFVSKLDTTGQFTWTHAVETNVASFKFAEGIDLDLDSMGNIFSIGGISLSTVLDPYSGSTPIVPTGDGDMYLKILIPVTPTYDAWVDFGFTGTETGRMLNPRTTLTDTLTNTPSPAMIIFNDANGTTSTTETATLDRAMTLKAANGPVRIGEAAP